ncbi:mrna-capping enzyme [Quercus suber]|uniref:mRNA guanylyltransferase n=1 Tax=Quercus suber TaxID=58331 RepID=A0AAW0JKI2_QUESU
MDEEYEQRIESAVEIARRERDERRKRLKREQNPDDHRPVVAYNDKTRTITIPSGWLECPAVGEEICGFIVPSKVPLCESFEVPPGKRYSLKQLIHQQRVLGRKIGLVIDLTNTARYYAVSDLKNEGIKHVKIQCKGRDAVPDNVSVNKFVHEVSQFISRQKSIKYHVLVHCTHGHNRTGFMIVHYIMRSLFPASVSVTQAINVFAEARPPGIYKPEYIDALYAFYHEKKPRDVVVCPPTPEWKRCSDDYGGGSAADPLHETRDEERDVVIMSNDDVLGDEIPWDQQDAMRSFCYQTLRLSVGARGNTQFPGSHPVSLNKDNLQLLRQHYYYTTWKADGTRYMMLITVDGCYLIDRNFNFRRVQMRFPCRDLQTHHYTLLDGEMVIDSIKKTDKKERRYLIYDMMAINQVSVIELPFYERWKMLEKEVIEPRNYERANVLQCRNPYYRYDLEPFRVRRKDFWLLSTVNKVLELKLSHESDELPFYERWKMLEKEVIEPRNYERANVLQCRNPYYRYDLEPFRVRRKDFWLLSTVNKVLELKLSHESDGLIFQGWDDPYVPRTHEGLLKWKFANMNSVDFLFEVNGDNRQLLFLHERGRKRLMEGNYRVAFKDGIDPSSYSGKIIECSWDSEKDEWIFMRIRLDKSTPNDFNTYKKVVRSIRDNITKDILLNEIEEIARLPMYVDRIQNDSKARHQTNLAPHG